MKNSNRQFEETGAFLDLMSKRERRRWEQEQAKLKEEKELLEQTKELTDDNTTPKEEETIETPTVDLQEKEEKIADTNSLEAIADTITQEELESELEKTKQLLSLTNEIKVEKEQIKEEPEVQEEDIAKTFNPVTPLGLVLIIMFGLFVFLCLFTKYDNSTFLMINGIILLFLTFCFGLTVLSNRKHVKVFAIFDLLIVLVLIIFNGVSITNYDNIYNKTVDIEEEKESVQKPVVENNTQEDNSNEYQCTNEDKTISVIITEKNNHITNIYKVETFATIELAESTLKFYQNNNGIEASIEDNKLTINFDFSTLDIEQYKSVIQAHNSSYRLDTDFSYIEEKKINFNKYIDIEMKNLTCNKFEKNT